MANQTHSKLIRDTKKLLVSLNCTVDYIGSDQLRISNNKATFILKVDNKQKNELINSLKSKGFSQLAINAAMARLYKDTPQYIIFFKVPKHFAIVRTPANTVIQVVKKLIRFDYLDSSCIKDNPIKYQI